MSAGPGANGSGAPRGPRLHPSDELCFRQIHPHFLVKGRLSSQAFRLREGEHGLSVSLGSKTTVEAAFTLYTRSRAEGGKGLLSCGTWAVTTAESEQQTCGVHEDPTEIDAAHGLIDMSHLKDDKSRRRSVETQLRLYAEERGCVYGPGATPDGNEEPPRP